MSFFKRFFILLISALFILSLSLSSFCAAPDISDWFDAETYEILSDGSQSNSAVDCVILKIKRDYDSNRLHMLFMVEMSSFNSEENAGLKIRFSNIGTVKIMCSGESEYDDELFFAEINGTLSDVRSKTLFIETTVGIKDGIPDDLILDFTVYDTDGIASNTFSADISVESEDAEAEGQNDGDDDEDSENGKKKTTKKKTTKKKTTKKKTTKKKTTKKKTTKKNSSKQGNDDDEEFNYYDSDSENADIILDGEDRIESRNERRTVLITCAASMIACLIGGCAVFIANKHKNNNGGK